MLRIASHAIKTGTVLYPKRIDYRLVRISQSMSNLKKFRKYPDREPCPLPPPPPPPKPKDDTLFWGTMFAITIAGSFAVYAQRSPEIRDWLSIYAPWFDDIIAVLYQENMTYTEYMLQCTDSLRRFMNMKDRQQICEEDAPARKDIPTVPDKPKTSLQEIAEKADEPCALLPAPIAAKEISHVENCLKDLFQTVHSNYETAKVACAYYNQLVEDTMEEFSISKLKDLYKAKDERLELVRVSMKNAQEAESAMVDLSRYLECGEKSIPDEVHRVKDMMEQCREKMKASFIQYQWENDQALIRDRQWELVASSIDKYTEENEILVPGLHYTQNKFRLDGDPDLLLYHTYRYKQDMEEELQEVLVGMKERTDRAVETICSKDEKGNQETRILLENTMKAKRADVEKEYKIREENLKKRNEDILKEALKKQAQRHEELLARKLQQRAIEATAKLEKQVAESVAAEKRLFAKQHSEMAIKLKILEDKLAAHLKAEKETKRSQELWAAASSLLAASGKGDPNINISKELNAIERASGDEDKLVSAVMKTIPKSVWDEGVASSNVLREKYYKMEKTALKVALVEQEGSPLPIYFISWLQSMFLYLKVSGIPQIEVDNPPKEPSKELDTFDTLQRARFWLERGNLSMAIRYVASLEGASLVAAESWLNDARTHLEIRQAAEAIIAHAAALGLQYI